MTTPQLLKLIEYIELDAICSSNVSNTEFYLPQIKKSVARIQWFPHIASFKDGITSKRKFLRVQNM